MATQSKIVHVNPETGEVIKQDYNSNAALVTDLNEASIIDDSTTAGVVYLYYAPVGTLSSAASWKGAKLVTVTGVKTWADGNSNYDNVADNRASLPYS